MVSGSEDEKHDARWTRPSSANTTCFFCSRYCKLVLGSPVTRAFLEKASERIPRQRCSTLNVGR